MEGPSHPQLGGWKGETHMAKGGNPFGGTKGGTKKGGKGGGC